MTHSWTMKMHVMIIDPVELYRSQNLTESDTERTVGENRNRLNRNQSVGEWNQESKH